MELKPGGKLGVYEIVSLLGKGGMGEVWKAHDPQIGRDVAIKVSAKQFTDRFEREVRAIGALNHPNICTLYHVGPNYLVLELVEGPTLAERIKEGPIPLEKALGYLKQIAEALEAAHEKGITHRDLKPANIKIRPDGASQGYTVKVLDFGLATAPLEEQEFGPDSPTMLTAGGMILGTAGYMSPEQARGKKADNRADIWAFGVVLFEMVTGKRLFAGETVSDSLAATLAKEPDLSSAPEKIRPLLRACTQKDPRQRLQAIGDWKLLLAEDVPASSAAQMAPRRRMTPWIATAVFAVVALGSGFVAWRHYSEQPQVLRMTLQTPGNAQFANPADIPIISPDGRHVAFAAQVDGKTGLWLRDLDALGARLLPGTDGAIYPFWSPASRWVAFFAGGKLKKIDFTGGPAVTLCDVPQGGRSGTWNKEDVIVYAANGGGLFRVPAAGGTPTPLSELDRAASEANHRLPWFLPDGRHFLYTARSDDPQKSRIYVDSIDANPRSKTRREVLAAHSGAVYVPRIGTSLFGGSQGYLLFMRETTLMAQPFDPTNARTAGNAVPVAEHVDYVQPVAQGQFSASQNGIVVYTSDASRGGNVQLTWFDRTGKPGGTVGAPGPILWASLSPDGSTIAADRQDASGLSDIWLHDLARGTASRFTFGSNDNFYPLWSPDGSRIAFFSQRGGLSKPWQKASNGVGKEEILDNDPRQHRVDDWSRNGRYFIENVVDPKTGNDIWAFPTFRNRKPFAYINTEFREGNAKFSPNGQFVAYVSDESKRNEVYVQTFPEHGGKWQASTGGGDFPVWSHDGHEMYFIAADRRLMAVEVKGDGKNFVAGVPKPLFEVRQPAQFDVSRDGRFLIHVPQETAAANVPLTVVVNWQAGLKK